MKWKSVTASINLGVVSFSGSWEPTTAERSAAWDIYVELVTRVTLEPREEGTGMLREALTSYYSLFGEFRSILRQHGPDVGLPSEGGEISVARLAVTLLNQVLRPLLTKWHPRLQEWEIARPDDVSIPTYERSWSDYDDLQSEIESTRRTIIPFAGLLMDVAQVKELSEHGVSAEGSQ